VYARCSVLPVRFRQGMLFGLSAVAAPPVARIAAIQRGHEEVGRRWASSPISDTERVYEEPEHVSCSLSSSTLYF